MVSDHPQVQHFLSCETCDQCGNKKKTFANNFYIRQLYVETYKRKVN